MMSEKNVYTESYPVLGLAQCFKIYTYWYTSLHAQAYMKFHIAYYSELPTPLTLYCPRMTYFLLCLTPDDFTCQREAPSAVKS